MANNFKEWRNKLTTREWLEGHTEDRLCIDYLIAQASKLEEVEEEWEASGYGHENIPQLMRHLTPILSPDSNEKEKADALRANVSNLKKAGVFDRPSPQNVDIEDKPVEDTFFYDTWRTSGQRD